MRSYMPGEYGWVNHGPRKMNSFDKAYIAGRIPMWIRDFEPMTTTWEDQKGRPVGYNRPYTEEPYVNALRDFFGDKIDLIPPKPRQDLQRAVKDWLHSVMHDGRSTRDIAKEMGISQPAVVQARKRAVDQLVESCGGKERLAEKLRQYLADRELQDGRDRLKYLPVWVRA